MAIPYPTPELIRTAANERYLRDTDVAERYSVHRNSVHRWAKEGKIPRPVTIGGSRRWRLSDLIATELDAK
ncbi:helix-turn-helix transcriptional regulator [Billgrantia montanilacus]|uniref:DNA-binding protein n=1 Tax=Billgrantia montanilacus TaxID=2282305 RepID=A0A368U612_9GAMM|nr:helix-turn-helix domain-containing protein [Halomonas montanilacus]RCV90483.1 DNA-binding protein [Halomonas montanilacus]